MSGVAMVVWLFAHNVTLDPIDPWSGDIVQLPEIRFELDLVDPWSGKLTEVPATALELDPTDPWR